MYSKKDRTNYKKWSFKFLMYIILLNFLIAFMVANTTSLKVQVEGYGIPNDNSGLNLLVLTVLTNFLFLAGIVLTMLSIKNKEAKNYQYKFSIWGYPIFIILTLISMVFG